MIRIAALLGVLSGLRGVVLDLRHLQETETLTITLEVSNLPIQSHGWPMTDATLHQDVRAVSPSQPVFLAVYQATEDGGLHQTNVINNTGNNVEVISINMIMEMNSECPPRKALLLFKLFSKGVI